jgi:hypothetical protein
MVYEGGGDSTASVPRGRAHAIKRFRADRQTIFKKDIFLKKDFVQTDRPSLKKIFFLKKILIFKKKISKKKDFYRVMNCGFPIFLQSVSERKRARKHKTLNYSTSRLVTWNEYVTGFV